MNGEVIDDLGLWMSRTDNVLTAIDDLSAGVEIVVDGTTIRLTEDVPFGHKFARCPIDHGDTVYKYGEVIGRATASIDAGEWVHGHNCKSTRGRGDLDATATDGGES